MAKREPYYSIVIVCEGENTEPLYFSSIAKKIQEQSIWGDNFSITILPKPKQNDADIDEGVAKHKTKRGKRSLLAEVEPLRREVEEEYKPQPISFVREAQLELSEGTYNQAWCVFDFDHRNPLHIEEAFTLAKDGTKGIIEIAYSSVAFEHWYLLHFERNCSAFLKSECRIGRTILECNSGYHPEDCFGASCVGGYLRNKNYLIEDTKGDISLFPELEPRLETAFFNSSWLRFRVAPNYPKQAYNLTNPITDVDQLVKRLLNIRLLYTWIGRNAQKQIGGYSLFVSKNNKTLSANIYNVSGTTKILLGGQIRILNGQLNSIYMHQRIAILDGDHVDLIFDLAIYNDPQFFVIEYENQQLACFELN